jgi:hypothetical protein
MPHSSAIDPRLVATNRRPHEKLMPGMIRPTLSVALLWSGLLVAGTLGCSSTAKVPGPPADAATDTTNDTTSNDRADSSADGPDATADSCAAVRGKSFASVNPMECGLGPNGVVTCHWSVVFHADGTFAWAHSDVSESGTYSCDGASITGVRGGGAIIVAHFDDATGTLTWDGAAYVLAP